MKGKIEYLDFAKGYAIFTIVLYHACQRIELTPMLGKAIIFGGTGVHLFFLLSGLGLGMSKSASSAGEFYRRRMTKVWLPYVFVLTISLLASLGLGLFPDGVEAWLAGVLLYQMFFEKFVQSFGGHFWFISAIIQFYIAFPALLWLKNRIGNVWAFFGLMLLVSIAWWEFVFILGKGGERIWGSCFLQFLWEFALGMALAETGGRLFKKDFGWQILPLQTFYSVPKKLRHESLAEPRRWWVSLPIALIFTGLMIFMILKMGEVGRIFNDIPALIGYTALSIFLFHFGDKFVPPLKNFFLWIGGFSFSLYLVHILVLEIYLQLFQVKNLPVTLPLLLPFVALALAAGWAFEPVSRWWTGLFEGRKREVRLSTPHATAPD